MYESIFSNSKGFIDGFNAKELIIQTNKPLIKEKILLFFFNCESVVELDSNSSWIACSLAALSI